MKRYCFSYCILFFISILFAACAEEARPNISRKVEEEKPHDSIAVTENKVRSEESKDDAKSKDSTAFAVVDNLRVREQPDLDSKVVSMLREGEEIIFLGEKSNNTESVELRGHKTTAPFFKIKTLNGEIGWVFGGGIDFKKPTNTTYKAVVAFFVSRQNEDAEMISDWSVYSSEALDAARKAGLITLFVDNEFEKVSIKDNNDVVIDVVNLRNFANKYQQGIVCLEKGKSPYVVEFSPEMEQQVRNYYSIKN